MGIAAQRHVQKGQTLCRLVKEQTTTKLVNISSIRVKFFPTAKKQPDGIKRDSHNDAGALKCGQEYISHMLDKDAAIFFFFIVQYIFALGLIILRKHEAIKPILQTHKQLQQGIHKHSQHCF